MLEQAESLTKTQKSDGKVLQSIIWDALARGIIFSEYIEKWKTFRVEYYTALLERLIKEIKKEKELFRQDDTLAQTSVKTMTKLKELNYGLLHPCPHIPQICQLTTFMCFLT